MSLSPFHIDHKIVDNASSRRMEDVVFWLPGFNNVSYFAAWLQNVNVNINLNFTTKALIKIVSFLSIL